MNFSGGKLNTFVLTRDADEQDQDAEELELEAAENRNDENDGLNEKLVPIKVNDWCVVDYEGQLFPSEVKQIIGDEYEVSVMHPAQ